MSATLGPGSELAGYRITGALGQGGMGTVYAAEHAILGRKAALRETVSVGLAEGVRLPSDSVDRTLAQMRSMPPHHTTSMGNDLIRGNRLELPWFAGKVVELGRRHGIKTPVNGFIYAALKPYVQGAPA